MLQLLRLDYELIEEIVGYNLFVNTIRPYTVFMLLLFINTAASNLLFIDYILKWWFGYHADDDIHWEQIRSIKC